MSRRGGLAILMRARMRAASDPNTIVAEAQSRGPAELNDGSRLSSPPASAAPGNSNGNESVSSAALIKDAKGWMRASISMDRKLTDTTDTALREFLKAYSSLSSEGRRELLHVLVQDYDVDRVRVRYLMQQYLSLTVPCSDEADDQQQLDSFEESSTHSVFYRIERNLRDSLKPLYAIFFEQLNAQPGGLKLLVDLRADLLSLLEEENIASIRALDLLLKEKLATWLSPATLELRQITWDDPASLLEKIVAYEAVHPIINLLDLKRRLSVGRRCFGYLHPAIPGEPLIFIEVALLKDVAKSIEEVLWDSPPIPEPEATCALFYSISSTQLGLSGINLGKFLIKRAIKLLVKEMPHVSTFATLSPVPGYMQWLMSKLVYHSKLSESVAVGMSEDASNLTENILHPVEERQILDACLGHTTGRNGMEVMEKLLASPTYEWARNDELLLALKPPLLRLCARYLLKEKKRGKALDTVANFHLQNGAMIERINWMSDKSEKGLRQSGGIMVNYIYRLDKIKENAQAYSKMGDIQASINFSSYQDSR